MTLIPAREAAPEVSYYVPENGIEVRAVQGDEGPVLTNVDTGGAVTVPPDFLLSDEPGETAVPEQPAQKKAPKRKKATPARVVGLGTNIQGGVQVEFESSKVILLGPNGSHKTTIARALELAGSGKASDVAGRGVTSKAQMLLPLVDPQRDTEIAAVMVVEYKGETHSCSYRVELKGEGKVSQPALDTGGLKVVFPLREVLDELRGSPERAQRWLMKTAAVVHDRAAMLQKLPTEAVERFPALADPAMDFVTALLNASQEAPRQARKSKTTGEQATKRADAQGARLGLRPTDEALEATELEHHTAVQAVKELEERLAPYLSLPTPEQVAERRQITSRLEGLAQVPLTIDQATTEDQRAALRLLNRSLRNSRDKCIICAGDLPIQSQQAIVTALEAALADNSRRQQADMERVRLKRKLGQIPSGEPAPPEALVELQGVRAQAQQAHGTLAALQQSLQGWKEVDVLRQQARQAQAEQRVYAYLSDELKALVAEAVEGATASFCERVQKLLPEGDRFWLDGRTGRYGLARQVDGESGPYTRRDSALCGAEWARVTLAIAGASTPADADLSILIPEDRAWDPKTLRETLAALTDYPGMIVVTTTVKPHGRTPKGWQVIELEG